MENENSKKEQYVRWETSKEVSKEKVEKEKIIAYHTLGFSGSARFSKDVEIIGGIFNTEQVLQQGLLSADTARKANIQRSNMGYSPQDPFLNLPTEISLYSDAFFEKVKNIHPWSIRCDIDSDKLTFGNPKTDAELRVSIRIKPKEISSIRISGEILNINIREYLNNLFSISEAETVSFDKAMFLHTAINQVYRGLVNLEALSSDKVLQIQMLLDQIEQVNNMRINASEEDYEHQQDQFIESIKTHIPLIFEVLKSSLFDAYANVDTIKDYLDLIHKKYNIPINIDK